MDEELAESEKSTTVVLMVRINSINNFHAIIQPCNPVKKFFAIILIFINLKPVNAFMK